MPRSAAAPLQAPGAPESAHHQSSKGVPKSASITSSQKARRWSGAPWQTRHPAPLPVHRSAASPAPPQSPAPAQAWQGAQGRAAAGSEITLPQRCMRRGASSATRGLGRLGEPQPLAQLCESNRRTSARPSFRAAGGEAGCATHGHVPALRALRPGWAAPLCTSSS